MQGTSDCDNEPSSTAAAVDTAFTDQTSCSPASSSTSPTTHADDDVTLEGLPMLGLATSTHAGPQNVSSSASNANRSHRSHHSELTQAESESMSSQSNVPDTPKEHQATRQKSDCQATTSAETFDRSSQKHAAHVSSQTKVDKTVSTPQEGQITRPGCIFVSIAAYRDPECQWTICDLFKQAQAPELVTVGVVWQVDAVEDAVFVRVAGPKTRHRQVRVKPSSTYTLQYTDGIVHIFVFVIQVSSSRKRPFFVLKSQVDFKVCLTLDCACQLQVL